MKIYLQRTAMLVLIMIGLSFSASAAKFSVDDSVKIKGFHLDMRIQVMKPAALKTFVKKLSNEGINTIIMEWEGSYPFLKEPLIANRYAYTRQEVIDNYEAAGLEDFELFWDNKPVNTLHKFGLLSL